MTIWKEELTLESATERSKGTMVEYLGIEFTEVTDSSLTAKMPVDHRTRQPLGIMHGGASCVLAETVGSLAANYAVDRETSYCVGLSINTSHIKAASKGYVFGCATPTHLGRRTQVWQIDISNEAGATVSSSRLTMMVMDRKRAAAEK
jgi:1,4-dihydroxy-2-naphthoyl-CoA hydrolase